MNGTATRFEITKAGVGFGSALAMAISFHLNASVFWAIVHGLFGWLYVVWHVLFH